MNSRSLLGVALSLALVLSAAGCKPETSKANGSPVVPAPRLQKVVVNEAARTLLYLPLYHALEKGYFRDNNLDVEVVTGGTATNSFAALISGEAQFSQADPMYVAISREKGARTKVVAQVVGRIALWALAKDPNIKRFDQSTLKGRTVSTHLRPMTAYTYTVKTITESGLRPDKDVKLITSKPGSELAPFLSGAADFVVTIEPSVSLAEARGGHVVYSYPARYKDQVFTGLMTTEQLINRDPNMVKGMVSAYQKSLTDIRSNPASAIRTALKYFPQLKSDVVERAMKRMIEAEVIPKSIVISEQSWNNAIKARIEAGDLKKAESREEGCAVGLMETVGGR